MCVYMHIYDFYSHYSHVNVIQLYTFLALLTYFIPNFRNLYTDSQKT